MAGGTGGHVYPALAVADELRSRGVAVIWLGTRKGIEARLVPAAGITVEWLGVSGLRGKSLFSLLLAPMNIVIACAQAMMILLRHKPCAVLGMGGFVSGPGGLMAWCLQIPLLIHEQNAVPGLTNKLLSKLTHRVMEAFPHSFNKKSLHVGNPVRTTVINITSPEQRLVHRQGALRLLIFGGSLGAAQLNEVVPQALAILAAKKTATDSLFEVHHQAGPKNLHQARMNYSSLKVDAKVDAYIDDMAAAYAWADLVICRAGAMTIAEMAAAGVASILVPYPYAVDDHQTSNAKFLADADAAILLSQQDFNAQNLARILIKQDRQKIIDMAVKARCLGMPESTRLVAEQCLIAGGCAC
jgi:UDP-N-acetylglucosamine--N-acetylmuramyl-(pentapeptide) pyrophosphoryl-undecaprenol N-acetylglucosamine transferase